MYSTQKHLGYYALDVVHMSLHLAVIPGMAVNVHSGDFRLISLLRILILGKGFLAKTFSATSTMMFFQEYLLNYFDLKR
jgi:hypothetical protein